jgi:hypothetical protein
MLLLFAALLAEEVRNIFAESAKPLHCPKEAGQ